MAEPNYLLGHGENLAKNENVATGFGEGNKPYTLDENRAYLARQASVMAKSMDALPREACPGNESVAVVTLHPRYLSKSSYPDDLLREAGLRAVGSKAATVTPRKTGTKKAPAPSPTTELFVAGTRPQFSAFANGVGAWRESRPGADDLVQIEALRAPSPEERVRQLPPKEKEPLLEVVLHAGENRLGQSILEAFRAYLQTLDVGVDLDARIDAGGLSFIPVRVPRGRIEAVARFSFLRLAREMPRLRQLRPMDVPRIVAGPFKCRLPVGKVADPTIRAAIFDGGCMDVKAISPWVRRIDADGVTAKVEEFERHGLAVTSAALFGPLVAGKTPALPYAQIDHYRVLDASTASDPQIELYPVLKRIVAILEREHYDFVNLSIGPAVPIDDDDVHPWTAKLDPLLSTGKTFAAVAVGNSGEDDAATRLNRIQPPSDLVNAYSVGSCSNEKTGWKRAVYSSVGHGRCPGVMKPDGVTPGGTPDAPFWTISEDGESLVPIMGTSFASPYGMHTAMGVRAHLGPVISSLGLQALLIHTSDACDNPITEVGWGRICTDIASLVTCTKGTCNVLYQGELDPRKFLRAQIPIPSQPLPGLVTISATLRFAAETDPDHPSAYTRCGLQVFFRKDRLTVPAGKKNPKTSGFFGTRPFMSETELRNDAHQWETARRATVRVQGKTLRNPCLDIHYNPRQASHDAKNPKKIPYAMVITVHAPKVPNLYDLIYNRYRFQLAPLRPQLQLRLPPNP